jgi:hypothetical protein
VELDLPFREEVYVGNWTEAGFVNGLLEREGIDTIVADAKVAPQTARLRAVYVLDEAQVARAREIVSHYLRGEPLTDPKSYRSWRCRACNELVEGQFQACWKCGAGKGG